MIMIYTISMISIVIITIEIIIFGIIIFFLGYDPKELLRSPGMTSATTKSTLLQALSKFEAVVMTMYFNQQDSSHLQLRQALR